MANYADAYGLTDEEVRDIAQSFFSDGVTLHGSEQGLNNMAFDGAQAQGLQSSGNANVWENNQLPTPYNINDTQAHDGDLAEAFNGGIFNPVFDTTLLEGYDTAAQADLFTWDDITYGPQQPQAAVEQVEVAKTETQTGVNNRGWLNIQSFLPGQGHPAAVQPAPAAPAPATQQQQPQQQDGRAAQTGEKRGRGRPKKAPEEKISPPVYTCRYCARGGLKNGEGLREHMAFRHQILPPLSSKQSAYLSCNNYDCDMKFVRARDLHKHQRDQRFTHRFVNDKHTKEYQYPPPVTREEYADTFALPQYGPVSNSLIAGRAELPGRG